MQQQNFKVPNRDTNKRMILNGFNDIHSSMKN